MSPDDIFQRAEILASPLLRALALCARRRCPFIRTAIYCVPSPNEPTNCALLPSIIWTFSRVPTLALGFVKLHYAVRVVAAAPKARPRCVRTFAKTDTYQPHRHLWVSDAMIRSQSIPCINNLLDAILRTSLWRIDFATSRLQSHLFASGYKLHV